MSAERIEIATVPTKRLQSFEYNGGTAYIRESNIIDATSDATSAAFEKILTACDYDPDITKVYYTKRTKEPVRISESVFMLRVGVVAVKAGELREVFGVTINDRNVPSPRFGALLPLIKRP